MGIDRISPAEQLDLRGVGASWGIWAPCLTYDKGTFYLVYTVVKAFYCNMYDTDNYLYLHVSYDEDSGKCITLLKAENKSYTYLTDYIPVEQGKAIYLKLELDCGEAYGYAEAEMQKIGPCIDAGFLSDEACKEGWFTGTMIGICCLLCHTEESIPNISEMAGFQSSSSCHRYFTRIMHITPGEYRRQMSRPDSSFDGIFRNGFSDFCRFRRLCGG